MEIFIKHQDTNTRKEDAVNFFINHKTNSYISHSEILSGRAESATEWSENFAEILATELEEDDCNLITMEDIHNQIIGIAILRIYKKYLIIEDMIIDGNLRGLSLGKKLMDFIHNFATEQKIKALFLESGITNDKAHSFFEKNGFKKVSVTYTKILPEN
ncbi:GNAT family N-acetyltransferase [Elizabethkingia meningoseptica]|uniref:GNAT family N-acetyltransferase n=1 Tax=Elizabethkingia meningoseptica TaxID=238 RepID=UPI0023B01932|nr:GNAT family N-acetyltransferase [Elizabethkingia meningoseptica]MDE5432152.1 GNAT family N-acetyltransferase [Elizabethkingia meningoseptica]MDE5438988.1 GNAT family N-acetyltransferase [Elizabethkingia meningoseptica]MDE5509522.1 GNAT family N-acetyltransferase [Elizabethkingia meningoseptica]MDE5516883.1 GNAT family N-acetyltransferase [Elizabethkingia meningoseptica]MDE5531123.1 GNAT family N-acetyltransferase [Elizabethkingia meningoseptica]